jgi:hypothetical protein
VLLRGTVDLLFRERDRPGWVLVDHKAAEVTALQVPSRLDAPDLQLRLYALALAVAGPGAAARPVAEAHVEWVAPGVTCRVDVGGPGLEDARRILAEFVRARRTHDLPPRPGPLCRTCPHRAACPAGAEHVAAPRRLALVP